MQVKKICILGLILSFVAFLIIGCSKGEDATFAEKADPYANPKTLISAEQLSKILGQPDLTIIDTRPRDTYQQGHIPGAICFNVKTLTDSNRPGKFISPKHLGLYIREYGISSSDRIVVYSDGYSHARLWFYLNMYGLNVQILNGGFEQWTAKGYETTTGRERRANKGKFRLVDQGQDQKFIIQTAGVQAALENREKNIVIDARSAQEYSGGHIPGAINITWEQLVNKDQTFKNTTELKEIFTKKEVTPDKQIIVYSNNAARASYVYFVLNKLLGYNNIKVYDGFYLYWATEKPLLKGSY